MVGKLVTHFLALCLALVVGFCLLIFLSIDREPSVLKPASNSGKAYQRAEVWLERIQQAFFQDQLNRLVIDPDDIEGLAFYAAQRAKVSGKKVFTLKGVETEFIDSSVIVRSSVKPLYPEGIYLNIELSFSEHDGKPSWDYIKVGQVWLPGAAMSWLWRKVLPMLPEQQSRLWATMTGAIKDFSILPGNIALVYRSDQELRQQLKDQAVALMVGSPEEKEAIQLYLDVLYSAAAQQGGTQLQMSRLLRTMVGLARARSSESSAVEENQRMLRAFAIQVSDDSVRTLLAPGMKPHPISRPILLRGRSDLTQHFMVSAALALTLDEETALGIGVSKERADSQAGGSGFSFSDLVADMAGIRFAEIATRDEEKARWLQEYLLKDTREDIYMPEIAWLPDGLSASAYSDLVRHPLYPAMLDRIEKRIDSLPILSK